MAILRAESEIYKVHPASELEGNSTQYWGLPGNLGLGLQLLQNCTTDSIGN